MGRPLGALALVAAILMFFFNTEDDRALLAIAPGVAFIALGARRFMSAGD